jgi:hypothetical protein
MNGWSRSIPVSRTATVVPVPVQPAALATSEEIALVLVSRKAWLSVSGYTDLTRGSFRSPASVALSTSATKKCGDRVASSTLAVAEIFSTSPATVLTLSPGFSSTIERTFGRLPSSAIRPGLMVGSPASGTWAWAWAWPGWAAVSTAVAVASARTPAVSERERTDSSEVAQTDGGSPGEDPHGCCR